MSDVVISATITTLGLIITAIINSRQNKNISNKVDKYHKEVSGKMGELISTTKALGKAEGKAEEKEDNNNKK